VLNGVAYDPVVSMSVVVVSYVVVFIIGVLLGGFTGGALVGYYCSKARQRKPHPPPQPPAPLYEDVVATTQEKLELKENVAYGQIN